MTADARMLGKPLGALLGALAAQLDLGVGGGGRQEFT